VSAPSRTAAAPPRTTAERLAEYERRQAEALAPASAEAVERQHARGKLTAR
jgi:acetyl-CoA carboxylase carboxyltransferase component